MKMNQQGRRKLTGSSLAAAGSKGAARGVALTAVLLLLLGMLGGCMQGESGSDGQGEQEKEPETVLSLTVEEYPRVDGSTATIPLSEAFASSVMGLSPEDARQYIQHNTTHKAYVNLIDKKADIIFVTSPSEEELAYAKANNVELEVVPIVSEGFVFLTSKENPVDNLTLEEIQQIYMGEIGNWNEVGGADTAIIAYQRQPNSGSQTGMLDLVVSADKIMKAPKETIVQGMGELVDAVAKYSNQKGAIGYSYYYYVTDMWINENVKLLAVDGVHPDAATISDGTYPIQTAYYAVLLKDTPKDSNARKLLDWILSGSGQQTAKDAGYVKLGDGKQ